MPKIHPQASLIKNNRSHFELQNHRVLPTFLGQLKLRYGYGLDISGKTAYVADFNNGVAIVDITTAATPRLLSTYSTLPGFAYDVAILGQLLLVANNHHGFLILDISNPSGAIFKGSLSLPSYTWAVVAQNNKAYIANYDLGLRIVDVSTATTPILQGTYDTAGLAVGVAIHGSLCFVADIASVADPGGVRILDISNPVTPVFKASYLTGSPVSTVLARSGLLFAISNNNIDIIDFSVDTQPTLKGRYSSSNNLFKLDISPSEGHLYATSYLNGMEIINIQNITNPVYVGKYEAPSSRGIKLAGNYVFLSAEAEGLMVFKKQRIIPKALATYRTGNNVRSIAVKNKMAYVADDLRLNIIDTSNSVSPVLKGSISVPTMNSLTVMNNYFPGDIILASAQSQGLAIVNATDASNPSLIKLFDTTGLTYATVTKDNLVFVADYTGFFILNMTSIQNPQVIGTYLGSVSAISIALTELKDFILLGDATKLSIININNLSSPTLISSIPVTQYIWGITVSGNIACLANFDNGLIVVDITNKLAPVVKSTFDVGGSAFAVGMLGTSAYVAAYQAGIQVIDITNLAQPEWIGEYVKPGGVYDLVLKNRQGYIAHGVSGLDILSNIIPSQEPKILSNTFLIHRGETRKFGAGYFSATDIDSDINKLIIRFHNILRAVIASSQNPGTSISQCLQSELAQVQVTHDGSPFPPAMSITVDDGFGEIPITPQPTQFTFVTTPPTLAKAEFTVSQGQTIIVDENNIVATTAGIIDPSLTIFIDSIANAQFEISSNPGVAIASFTQQNLIDKIIRLKHLGSEIPPSCRLSVGIVTLRSSSVLATITYINREDSPNLMNAQLEIDEGGSVVLSESNFHSSDPDGSEDSQKFSFTSLQHLEFFSSPQQKSVTEYRQYNITARHITARHDGSEIAPSGTVTVQDTTGRRDGPKPISIIFHNRNTAPTITTNNLSVTQGKRNPITLSNIDAIDSDTTDNNLTFYVQNCIHGYFMNVNTELQIDSFTKTDIKNGFIVFIHDDSNFAPSYDIYVKDDTGLQSETTLATITFNRVNHPPSIITNALNISEGGISVPVIAVADSDDSIGSLTVTVSNIEHCIFEKIEGNVITPVTNFLYSDYQAGKIRVRHLGDEFAPAYTLKVNDGKGGVSESSVDVTYTPQDNAPSLTANSLPVTQGARTLVTASFLDATDSDTPDNLITFYITNIQHGHFENTLNPNVSIEMFTKVDIRNGLIIFVHDNSKFAPSYDVHVGDGNTYSSNTTASITFTPVNQPPVIVQNTLTIEEAGTAVPNLTITDPDSTDEELQVSIFDLRHATFQENDPSITPVTHFSYSDYIAGKVQVEHNGDEVAPSYTVKVNDGKGGTAESVASITYTPKNDGPILTVNTLPVTQGARTLVTASFLDATDSDTPDNLITFYITNIQHGHFENTLNPNVPIAMFTKVDIRNGLIIFVHDNSKFSPSYDVQAGDGNKYSSSTAASITFTPVNQPPIISQNSLTIEESGISVPNLTISDPDSTNEELQVSIFDLQHATFQQNDHSTITPITQFAYSDYIAGKVQVEHNGDEASPSYTVKVNDGKGGTAESVASITYMPKNDGPILTVNSLPVTQGASTLVTASYLDATDSDTPDERITFYIIELKNGHFENTLNPGTPIQEFTKLDIKNGRIVFIHDNSKNAPSYQIKVSDGNMISNSVPATLNFTPVNQRPIISENGLTIEEGGRAKPKITITDPDSSDDELIITVSDVQEGTMELRSGDTIVPVMTFSYSDYKKELVDFAHNGDNPAPSYSLKANDGELDSLPSQVQVDYTPINAAPTMELNQATITEGKRTILGPGDILAKDDKTPSSELLFHVGPGPKNVRLEYCAAPGEDIFDFPQGKVITREVCLVPTNNLPPEYSLSVDDGELSSDFSKAVVAFTTQVEATSDTMPVTTRYGLALGGSLGSGVILASVRYALKICLESDVDGILKQRPQEIGEEYAKYYNALFIPVIKEVFNTIKTYPTKVIPRRSAETTKNYITAIEEVIKELTLHPQFNIEHYLRDGFQKTQLIQNIIAEIRKGLPKTRCCDSGYLKSYFTPEISPSNLQQAAPEIARAVAQALGVGTGRQGETGREFGEDGDSKVHQEGIEMQPISPESDRQALLPAFSLMSQKVSALETRLKRIEKEYGSNNDAESSDLLESEDSSKMGAEV